MTESVKDPHALSVTAQPQMLDKLQFSEVKFFSLLQVLSSSVCAISKIRPGCTFCYRIFSVWLVS